MTKPDFKYNFIVWRRNQWGEASASLDLFDPRQSQEFKAQEPNIIEIIPLTSTDQASTLDELKHRYPCRGTP